MNDSYEKVRRIRFILSVITNAVVGGGVLLGLLALVYVLGALAERLPPA